VALNIIVCTKQVPDPEVPPTGWKVDSAAKKVIPPPGTPPVISPYCEYALEAALRIKDKQGGKITVLSLGNKLSLSVLRKSLGVGADELVLLEDEAFEGGDAWSTAIALASAIKKIGEYDLIFCGRQASDWDQGQVGLGIAEILNIPSVSIAKNVEALDGKIKVERLVADGYEIVESSLPCLVTVTSESGDLRKLTIEGAREARSRQPLVWKPQDIGLSPSQSGVQGRMTKLIALFQPVKEVKCDIISGENPEEAAANLALKLREVKVI
jgi:electron transfer flavoprotein beta subunit